MDNKYRHREYLVNTIRSGVVRLSKVKILPPSFEQNIEAYQVYQQAYQEAQDSEIMSHEELENFYNQHQVFLKEIDINIKILQDDIEKTKEDLFNNYKDKKFVALEKRKLQKQKYLLSELLHKQHNLFTNTCENIAEAKRLSWLILQTSVAEDEQYSVEDNVDVIISEYNNFILSEEQIRDLCKNEPWKSLWNVAHKGQIKLFLQEEGRDITINQKNILSWSQIYDNIQESIDCPEFDVIQDDDFLDGWFISQSKKRKKEKIENEILSTVGEKTLSSDNAFIVANNKFSPQDINSLNSPAAKHIISQRQDLIKEKGSVKNTEFKDFKDKIQSDLQQVNK